MGGKNVLEEIQSHLVTAIAGAVIASALLGAASFERAMGEALALQRVLDDAAAVLSKVGCSAAHPFVRLDLGALLEGAQGRALSVLLLGDHLRALRPGGGAALSLRFPAIAQAEPLELLGFAALELRFDPVEERCGALRL